MSGPIEELSRWDMETHCVPDGYDLCTVVSVTPENLAAIIDKVNELIRAYNANLHTNP
jgi:hypothetical protein